MRLDFKKTASENGDFKEKIEKLREKVNEFAEGFEFLEEPFR